MPVVEGVRTGARADDNRLRIAAASSFVGAAMLVPIPIGYVLSAPGRGSETVFLANVLAAALLSVSTALGAQAWGFLSLLRERILARWAAAVMIGGALAVATVGIVFLVDRVPCQGGLYCSGQYLGPVGRLAKSLWIPVVGIGYLAAGTLLLGTSEVRRTAWFAGGCGFAGGGGSCAHGSVCFGVLNSAQRCGVLVALRESDFARSRRQRSARNRVSKDGRREIRAGRRVGTGSLPKHLMASTSSRSSVPHYRDSVRLQSEFAAKRDDIEGRLDEFRRVGSMPDERLFEELCFCILAVQSSAHSADAAVRALAGAGLLWPGRQRQLAAFLRHRTRFHNHKAAYIVRARTRFFPDSGACLATSLGGLTDPRTARAWLVREVDGLGWKESSHFLRNIGRGDGLAILDRHILRNLVRLGVIPALPTSLTGRRYLEIEDRMTRFSVRLGIPMAALDLLFWSRETGQIFK